MWFFEALSKLIQAFISYKTLITAYAAYKWRVKFACAFNSVLHVLYGIFICFDENLREVKNDSSIVQLCPFTLDFLKLMRIKSHLFPFRMKYQLEKVPIKLFYFALLGGNVSEALFFLVCTQLGEVAT